MSFVEALFDLKGKVAVVVGGGGVLGGAMAEGLAKAGADVAIIDPQCDKARKKIEDIQACGVRVIPIQMDATKSRQMKRASLEIMRSLGRVDILINAPGINSATPFMDISEEEWQKILDVNLKSMFLACQIFGQVMIDQKEGGSIINISSVSSGPPLSRVFTYSISKAGVNNLTQFLAREWAPHNIRVNALAPGFFPAQQNRKILSEERIADIFRHTPMNRFGEPEELIGAVIWLASERAASFVTGALIRVDGGFTAMTI
jgi:NAD(P)-dependent dehydrogenase (short-subunit alcohol dehydrogenase family)